MITSFELKDEVIEGRSGGAKYMDAKGRILLPVDISLHGAVPLDCIVLNTSIVGTLTLTTIEQILTDKLSVLFSRTRFRRSKDLYDVWLILEHCFPDESKIRKLLSERGLYPLSCG